MKEVRKYYFFVISLFVIILDYITKKLIVNNLDLGEQISVIGNFFLITSHRNRGAAFGILQDQRIFFIIITIAILAGIVWYFNSVRKSARAILLIGLTLVFGGAIGNFVDRVRFGEVVDFVQLNFGTYTFPIFNVADSAIVIGVILIILDTLIEIRKEQKGKVASINEQ